MLLQKREQQSFWLLITKTSKAHIVLVFSPSNDAARAALDLHQGLDFGSDMKHDIGAHHCFSFGSANFPIQRFHLV